MIMRTPFAAGPRSSAAIPMPGMFARFFSFEAGKVYEGTVKWFDTKKGFGFLVPNDGAEDVFVHQTSIYKDGFRSLAEGEPVEFKVVLKDNGRYQAEDVTGPNGEYVRGEPAPSSGGGYDAY
eukprot:CAMPEP_0172613488 /NCGR_PEP_ID=MMETSP1068-20121228/43690_1 /TAXON_ID=35684 /ORGANISM="Pseudopedinella elastica, Strain CCMP716" /LENGTH=121 /DNA_ID=CAMNT_0013417959 /DNA_START=73 /DNA_END=438 /DNA_ORIENTATION=-